MERELYTRQETLELTTPEHLTVVGCGGIGSWVAIYAAMSGVPNIYLYDPDVLEESNLNRLPFCKSSLNRPKVDVLKDYINGIREGCTVVAMQEKLDGLLLKLQLDISNYFIECTDSPRNQLKLYKACVDNGKKFIRAGYDGTHITVTSTVSGWMRDEEQETYDIAPSWVVPASVVAALAVGKMMKYFNQDTSLDISEIGNPVLEKNRRLTSRCTTPAGVNR